jgi:hypothetical protein
MTGNSWALGCVAVVGLAACGSGADSAQSEAQSPPSNNATLAVSSDEWTNSPAFGPHSKPFGTSIERWSERLWQWVYSVPTPQNPLLDTTGANCGAQQPGGPVWYLPPVLDPGGTASFTRVCTIPRGKALLMLTSGVLNDFPCPDPTFQPADGQTLFEFLLAGAQGGPNSVSAQSLSIDGVPLKHLFDYRATSDDLFNIVGDPSLQTSLDSCITGYAQPAVSDAFVVMLKPLMSGAHTLVYNAKDPRGTNVTLTYLLTVQ